MYNSSEHICTTATMVPHATMEDYHNRCQDTRKIASSSISRQRFSNSRHMRMRPSRFVPLLLCLGLGCRMLPPVEAWPSPYPSSSHHSSGGSSSSSSSTKHHGVFMVRSPESTIAPANDEVLFECELNLAPERVEWRFRSQNSVGNKEDYVYISKKQLGYNVTTIERKSNLRVYVSEKTIGEYQCVALLYGFAIASMSARLTLATISLDTGSASRAGSSSNSAIDNFGRNEHVPTVMRRVLSPIQQQHFKISPGNSIIIHCGDVISNPPPIWSYYKDGMAMYPNVSQLQTGGLILSSLTFRDTGTYWCSAVNSITGNEVILPQKTTIVVEHTPRSAPRPIYAPQNVSVAPGETALLECPGVANPIPTASWTKRNGQVLSSRTKNQQFGLQISNVIPEDQGIYICRLQNGIEPSLVHAIQLIVLQAPTILTPPSSTLTNESDSLELECQARGSPPPEIYWMINGDYAKWDELIRENGSKLLIRSVEKRHAGIVQCFARNAVGEVSESNLLNVNPKQIPGGVSSAPLGPGASRDKLGNETGKRGKGGKKHKYRKELIPPSRPSVTRLTDESVMVRWTAHSEELSIQFFKVQYRMLRESSKDSVRPQWMTENEDISPYTRSYEVNNLKSDHYYRFRIVAVFSNNDNKEGPASDKFHLSREPRLELLKKKLLTPTLSRIEAISQHAVQLHWSFPQHLPHPIDGFYLYYRPATTAGEYAKATVDNSTDRTFKIDHLEPGTSYEFKLQSFTAEAASEFSAILTGKTMKPPTPPTTIPSVVAASEGDDGVQEMPTMLIMIVSIPLLCFAGLAILCCCCKGCRKKHNSGTDETDAKAHISVDQNGFPTAVSNGGPRSHQKTRTNGINARMNITPNPLAQDGDKNRNVMELRFLPSTLLVRDAGGEGDESLEVTKADSGSGGDEEEEGVAGETEEEVKSGESEDSGSDGGTRRIVGQNPTNSNHHSNPNQQQQQHYQHQQQQQQLQHQQLQQQQLQQHQLQQQHHHNHVQHPLAHMTGNGQEHMMLASMPHRRTLDRAVRSQSIGNAGPLPSYAEQKLMLEGGDCGLTNSGTVTTGMGMMIGVPGRNSSMRRTRRGSGSVPGSPRIGRGPSSELLHHGAVVGRSPMPIRAGVKRAARLGRAENMSSGSLNSIEV